MKKERKFIVYKHTGPDGKSYIGMTSQPTLEERSRNGFGYARQPIFYEAIQKIGWENFRHEVLYENLEELQARLMERSLIRFYKSNEPEFGYNDTEGGEKPSHCKPHTEESKQKMREAQRGENNHFYGKHHKEEARLKCKICAWYNNHFGSQMKRIIMIEYKNIL